MRWPRYLESRCNEINEKLKLKKILNIMNYKRSLFGLCGISIFVLFVGQNVQFYI